MKKRYIIFNTLILICSLFLFLIVSLVSITQINKRNMEGEIKNYLRIVENGYDPVYGEYPAEKDEDEEEYFLKSLSVSPISISSGISFKNEDGDG